MILAAGHGYAYKYPLARLWQEARIVRNRESDRIEVELVGQRSILVDLSHDIWGNKGRRSNLFVRFLKRLKRDGDQ